jgi:hypothetical protein
MDARGCTTEKRMSDSESSGFDSVDSSSVDNVPEATIRDSDDGISATTETESDSLTSSDNEQLKIHTLDEEQTAVRVNLVQSVQNDDCTFSERHRKFYTDKCMPLKGSNKDRCSVEKEGEHIARNVQIIDLDPPINEQEAIALPEGNSGAVICPRYEPQKAMPLSLWMRNVTTATPEDWWKMGIAFYVHDQNIIAASQRCEKRAATGSREFYRQGTTVCRKYNQVGAAEVHEDHGVAAVQGMGREGDVSRGYGQSQVNELLPEYREEERSKDEDEKHNKEEKEKNVLEVLESKEEKERGKKENGKADKGNNKEKSVGKTPVYQKKIIEDKVRDNYFSLFSSASSPGEKHPKWNCGGHSKNLQKKVAESQQYSLFGHLSENFDREPGPGKVRRKFQFIYFCWPFEYLIVLGIEVTVAIRRNHEELTNH